MDKSNNSKKEIPAVLLRLIEEVRMEREEAEEAQNRPTGYNRVHNRHNRSGSYNRVHNRHNR